MENIDSRKDHEAQTPPSVEKDGDSTDRSSSNDEEAQKTEPEPQTIVDSDLVYLKSTS